jgi:hypothetical protein
MRRVLGPGHIAPRNQYALVGQLEQARLLGCLLDEGSNSLPPDLDALAERACLSDTRDHDKSRHGLAEKKILVLCQEDQLTVLQVFADAGI